MMIDLWIAPDPRPVQNGFDSIEGWPVVEGYETVPDWIVENPPVMGEAVREAKRWSRIHFQNIATMDWCYSADELEAGKFNAYRAWLYQLTNALRRLLNLCIGPQGWCASTNAAWGWDEGINFAYVWGFRATGSGTSIELLFGEENDNDPRSLSQWPNGGPRLSLEPCMFAVDSRGGEFGVAEIIDVTYTSPTSVSISLNKPLNAGRWGTIWVFSEAPVEPYPIFPLRVPLSEQVSPQQCRHAIKTFHHAYSSFAEVWPFADMAQGIDGQWFCARMADKWNGEPRLDLFGPQCNAIACPYYQALAEYYPQPVHVGRYFLGLGTYVSAPILGLGTLQFWGRKTYAGLLHLIGCHTGYNAIAWMPSIAYQGGGELRQHICTMTPEISALGIFGATMIGCEIFANQDEMWRWIVALGGVETDNVGPLAVLAAAMEGKLDPLTGGPLDETPERTPGVILEKAVGVRRTENLGMTPYADPAGPGDTMVQRVRPRQHTSAAFTLEAVRTNQTVSDADEQTIVECFDSLRPVHTGVEGSLEYDMTWQLPRFTEWVGSPLTRKQKVIATPVAVQDGRIVEGSGAVELEFALGVSGTLKPGYEYGPGQPVWTEFNSGGNVVRGEIGWELWCAESTGFIGDRQDRLYPGDVATLTHPTAGTFRVLCLAAQAFGGAEQTDPAPVAPDEEAAYVPEFIRRNYAKRDRAVFWSGGVDGDWLARYVAMNGVAGLTLTGAEHGAIMPPDAPVAVSRVDDSGAVVELDTETYEVDPVSGLIYIDSSAWAAGRYNLFFTGSVYDARKDHPIANLPAMERVFTAACDLYKTVPEIGGGSSRNSLCMGTKLTPDSEWKYEFICYADVPGRCGNPPAAGEWDFLECDYGVDAGHWGGPDEYRPITELTWHAAFFIYPGWPDPNEPGGGGVYGASFPGGCDVHLERWFSTVRLGRPRYWRAEDIADARIDVSIPNGFLREWMVPGGMIDHFASMVRLRAFWYEYDEGTGDIELEPIGDEDSWGEGTLSEIYEGQNPTIRYMRGTVDWTAIAKIVAADIEHSQMNFILVLIPPDVDSLCIFENGAHVTNADVRECIQSMTFELDSGGSLTDAAWHTETFYAPGVEFRNPRFRSVAAELLSCESKYNYDSYGKARVADLMTTLGQKINRVTGAIQIPGVAIEAAVEVE